MRHQKAGKKLNRTGSHRNAMFRNMVTSLFAHGRIRTTDAKAKELRRWADRMITLAKRGDLHARRQALSVMRDKAVVHKLFEDVQGRFAERAGGYTRVIKIGTRLGDAAPMSLVEFVTSKEKTKEKKKKSKVSRKPGASAKKASAAKPKDKKQVKGKKPAEKEAAAVEPEKTEDMSAVEVKASDKAQEAAEPGVQGVDETGSEEDTEKA
jgi:large subunit ribosomal protein L17